MLVGVNFLFHVQKGLKKRLSCSSAFSTVSGGSNKSQYSLLTDDNFVFVTKPRRILILLPDTVTPFTEVGRRGGASIPPQTSGRDGSVGRRGPSTEGSAGSGLWGLGRGRLDVKGRWRTETSKESGKKGVSEKGNKQ